MKSWTKSLTGPSLFLLHLVSTGLTLSPLTLTKSGSVTCKCTCQDEKDPNTLYDADWDLNVKSSKSTKASAASFKPIVKGHTISKNALHNSPPKLSESFQSQVSIQSIEKKNQVKDKDKLKSNFMKRLLKAGNKKEPMKIPLFDSTKSKNEKTSKPATAMLANVDDTEMSLPPPPPPIINLGKSTKLTQTSSSRNQSTRPPSKLSPKLRPMNKSNSDKTKKNKKVKDTLRKLTTTATTTKRSTTMRSSTTSTTTVTTTTTPPPTTTTATTTSTPPPTTSTTTATTSITTKATTTKATTETPKTKPVRKISVPRQSRLPSKSRSSHQFAKNPNFSQVQARTSAWNSPRDHVIGSSPRRNKGSWSNLPPRDLTLVRNNQRLSQSQQPPSNLQSPPAKPAFRSQVNTANVVQSSLNRAPWKAISQGPPNKNIIPIYSHKRSMFHGPGNNGPTNPNYNVRTPASITKPPNIVRNWGIRKPRNDKETRPIQSNKANVNGPPSKVFVTMPQIKSSNYVTPSSKPMLNQETMNAQQAKFSMLSKSRSKNAMPSTTSSIEKLAGLVQQLKSKDGGAGVASLLKNLMNAQSQTQMETMVSKLQQEVNPNSASKAPSAQFRGIPFVNPVKSTDPEMNPVRPVTNPVKAQTETNKKPNIFNSHVNLNKPNVSNVKAPLGPVINGENKVKGKLPKLNNTNFMPSSPLMNAMAGLSPAMSLMDRDMWNPEPTHPSERNFGTTPGWEYTTPTTPSTEGITAGWGLGLWNKQNTNQQKSGTRTWNQGPLNSQTNNPSNLGPVGQGSKLQQLAKLFSSVDWKPSNTPWNSHSQHGALFGDSKSPSPTVKSWQQNKDTTQKPDVTQQPDMSVGTESQPSGQLTSGSGGNVANADAAKLADLLKQLQSSMKQSGNTGSLLQGSSSNNPSLALKQLLPGLANMPNMNGFMGNGEHSGMPGLSGMEGSMHNFGVPGMEFPMQMAGMGGMGGMHGGMGGWENPFMR